MRRKEGMGVSGGGGGGQEEVSKGRETGDEIKEDRIEGRRGWGEWSGKGEGGQRGGRQRRDTGDWEEGGRERERE